MKVGMSTMAALAAIAGPALAQETPSTQNAPSAQNRQMEPSTMPGMPAPSMSGKQAGATTPAGGLVIGELREVEDDGKMVGPLNSTVDRVEEMDVYDANGKKIAEVDFVLEDKNGEVQGIAAEFGGFLGFGEKRAVLTLDQIKVKNGNIVVEMTEDQLPNLPAWRK